MGVDAGRLHLSATVADLRGRPLASVAHETGALTPSDVDDPAEAGSRRAAVQAVIDEALEAKKEGKKRVIVFNLSGHGLLDLPSFEAFRLGSINA